MSGFRPPLRDPFLNRLVEALRTATAPLGMGHDLDLDYDDQPERVWISYAVPARPRVIAAVDAQPSLDLWMLGSLADPAPGRVLFRVSGVRNLGSADVLAERLLVVCACSQLGSAARSSAQPRHRMTALSPDR